MRDYTLTIEFTTPSLATWSYDTDARSGGGDCIDKFKRTSSNDILFEPVWLFAALTGGIANAGSGIDVAPRDIQIDPVFAAETGTYHLGSTVTSPARETEAIMPGAQVSLTASTADHVTKDKLERILTVIGRIIGISPFGHSMGFGRFKVVEVKETSTDVGQEATWSPSAKK
jgi:hypothetical protein